MKNKGKTKRILAAVLAVILFVSAVTLDLPVYASETANDVSGNDISGNAISGNDVSNEDTPDNDISGNDVSGNDISGNDISGNDVSGNDVSGNDISGNDIPGNDISGNDIMLTDLDDENGLRIPDGDETYIKSISASLQKSGTAPFDGDDLPGNDSSGTNNIIRSFDNLVYSFNVVVNAYQDENGEDQEFDQDVICMEATIPVTAREAVFDTLAMNYLDTCEVVTNSDGSQTLKATYTMKKSDDGGAAVPGTAGMLLAIKVRAAENGTKIKPDVKFWMKNNDTSLEVCEEHNVEEVVSPELTEVTVSAAIKLNVQLKLASEGSTSANRDFDFNTGNSNALNKGLGTINGQSYCYGVTVQLYNPDSTKGMRGMALPEGDISFNIDFSSSYKVSDESSSNNGKTFTADSTEMTAYQPLVWSVDGNIEGATQQDERDITFITTQTYAVTAAPGNVIGGGSRIAENACENGGAWSAEASGDGSIKLTVSGYEIPLNSFPWRQLGSTKINTAHYYEPSSGMDISEIGIACFSAGEIWVVQPYTDEDTKIIDQLGKGDFLITASTGGNLQVTIDNEPVSYQQENGADDTATAKATPGVVTTSMSNRIRYAKKGGSVGVFSADILGGTDFISNGKDYAFIGENDGIGITSGIVYGPKNEESNRIAAVNVMMKFDSKALELTGPVDTMETFFKSGTHFYYGYLENETDWGGVGASEEERDTAMKAADEKTLNWDDTFVEGRNYVAVLAEKRNVWSSYSSNIYANFFSQIKVKDKQELVGNVYMICQVGRIWTTGQLENAGIELTENAIDAYIPSVSRKEEFANAVYPETHLTAQGAYEKARYNEAGDYLGGHTGQSNRGDSLYIYGFSTQISKAVALLQEKDGEEVVKTTYNLDRDECIVDYVLTPGFKGAGGTDHSGDGEKTVVAIVDTLPAGLEYNAGSAYIGGTYVQETLGKPGTVTGGIQTEPEIGTDRDGKTTLTWTLTDYKAGEDLPKIYFSCTVGSGVAVENGDDFVNTVTIAAENEGNRGFSATAGNLDTVTIDIITLGASGFSKSVEKKLVELSDDITYKVIYDNNGSSSSDFVIVNATPYSGDNGSVFAGSYDIASWKLDIAKISGNASDYQLYYTVDTKYVGVSLGSSDTDSTVSQSAIETSWTPVTINEDGTANFPDGVQPTAWALVGTLNGGKSAQVNYSIHQDTPGINDKLVSKGSEGEFIRSVYACRTNRIITGSAWLDDNQDGIKDTAEPIMEGLKVTLEIKNSDTSEWEQAYSLLNPTVPCETYTDNDGNYSFGTLPAGEYRVIFEDGSNAIKLAVCDVTTANAAADHESSRAASLKSGDTLTAATIETITMPTLENMGSVREYKKQYQNAGFTRQPVTYTPEVSKALTGEDAPTLEEGDYTFKLTPVSGAPMPKDASGAAVTEVEKQNGAANTFNTAKVTFDEISYTTEGTYEYKIEEVVPTGDAKDPSITYDSGEMTLTVVVGSDANGKLEVTSATYTKDGTFSNVYTKPTPAVKGLEVTKEVTAGTENGTTAADIPADIEGLFTFTLTAKGSVPMPGTVGAPVEKQNDADGEVSFGDITFTEAGTFQYEITENAPADGSWSQESGRVITATVVVTLNADNTLSAEVTYADGDTDDTNDQVFTNTYTLPASAEIELTAQKALTGDRTVLTDREFTFELTPVTTGAPMPVDGDGNAQTKVTATSDTTGVADLGKITYTEDPGTGKTYEYKIVEKAGNNASVTYDDSEYTVTVKVTKDASNALQTAVTCKKDGTAADAVVFTNTYTKPEKTSFVLEAVKELDGRTLKDKQFSFTLTPENGAPMPTKTVLEGLTDVEFVSDDSDNVTSVTVKNAADGSIKFPEISAEEDLTNFLGKVVTDASGASSTVDSYVYTYKINEVLKDVVGYTYDARTITATVTITKGTDNKLKAEVSYVSSEPAGGSKIVNALKDLFGLRAAANVLKNTYEKPKNTQFVLEGKKVLTGKDLTAGEFTFKLEPLKDAPGMEQTVKNKADGSFEFDKIIVSEIEDTRDFGDGSASKYFEYQITEVNEGKAHYTYDTEVYIATVEVRKNAGNELEVVDITYKNKTAEAVVDVVEFKNSYNPPAPPSDSDDDDDIIIIREKKVIIKPAPTKTSPKTGEGMPFASLLVAVPFGAVLALAKKKREEE